MATKALYRFHKWVMSLSNHFHKRLKVSASHFYKRVDNAKPGYSTFPTQARNTARFAPPPTVGSGYGSYTVGVQQDCQNCYGVSSLKILQKFS
jgi:hypothetical protein